MLKKVNVHGYVNVSIKWKRKWIFLKKRKILGFLFFRMYNKLICLLFVFILVTFLLKFNLTGDTFLKLSDLINVI